MKAMTLPLWLRGLKTEPLAGSVCLDSNSQEEKASPKGTVEQIQQKEGRTESSQEEAEPGQLPMARPLDSPTRQLSMA